MNSLTAPYAGSTVSSLSYCSGFGFSFCVIVRKFGYTFYNRDPPPGQMETGRTGACGRTRLQEHVDNEDRSARAQGKQVEKLGGVKQNRKNAETTSSPVEGLQELLAVLQILNQTLFLA